MKKKKGTYLECLAEHALPFLVSLSGWWPEVGDYNMAEEEVGNLPGMLGWACPPHPTSLRWWWPEAVHYMDEEEEGTPPGKLGQACPPLPYSLRWWWPASVHYMDEEEGNLPEMLGWACSPLPCNPKGWWWPGSHTAASPSAGDDPWLGPLPHSRATCAPCVSPPETIHPDMLER